MTPLAQELTTQIRKFALTSITPYAEVDDEQRKFRPEIFKGLGDLGITGITTEEKYDGAGLGYQELTWVLEELARHSVSYAVTLSVSSMVQAIIQNFGNEKQKSTYLPAMARGEEIGAFGLSESGSGSDAASLTTKAIKHADHYIINGRKMWISSAGVAKTYVVMARTGGPGAKGISAFIVRDGDPGFTFGKLEKKMGWRASPTRELIFDNCKIPIDRLIGQEGDGFKFAMAGLDTGRFNIGSIAVGLAQEALDQAVKYALVRQQFGQAIFDFQGLQFMLADMATEVECSRLLVKEAATRFDQGIIDQKLSAMAKLKATDTAMRVTTDAVQILGGVGYTQEFPLERFMRDAKVLQIVEGTNQIQKMVIARMLKKGN